MLEVMRKHSGSFIIYILFAIIIVVFVINFGPQSAGCTAGTSFAAKVAGQPISLNDFSYALSVSGVSSRRFDEKMMPRLRGMVMDQLIVREMLAQEAERIGLRVADKEIDDMILEGRFLALGQPQPLIRDDEGNFDYDRFSRYVRYAWGTTVKGFKAHQRRELLAEKLLTVMRAALKASPDEVRADYIHRNTQVQLEYVRILPTDFIKDVVVEPAAIDAFIKKNKERIRTYYDENKIAFSRLPEQLKLRVIELEADDPAAEQALADALVVRLKGGEPFGELATEHSAHWSKDRHGLVGWRNRIAAGLGEGIDPQVAKHKGDGPFTLSDQNGAWVVEILGKRAGDLTLPQAERDIAEELHRLDLTLEHATAQAKTYLAQLQPGQRLSDAFPSGEIAPPTGTALPDETSPRVSTTSRFSKTAAYEIPGLGPSKELIELVFELDPGEVADRPFVVGQRVYLIGVKERTNADLDKWKNEADPLTAEYLDRAWDTQFRTALHKRCLQGVTNKAIQVFVRMSQAPAAAPPGQPAAPVAPNMPRYQPCSSLGPRPMMM